MTTDELQALNFHWRLAIDQVSEGVLILQGDGRNLADVRVAFANQSAGRRLGYTPDHLIGLSLEQLVTKEDQQRLLREWQPNDSNAVASGRFRLMNRSQVKVPADWTISSRPGYPDHAPDHTMTLSWQTAEAKPPKVDAYELNKADTISHITRGIVHDFNNSLMAIRGQLEVAMPETTEGSSVHRSLTQAMEAAVTTSELCQRLLAYAKGRRSEKSVCVVTDLVNQSVSITSLGSNVTCRRRIDANLWSIKADGIQIVQVVSNLLMNAQQAMPHGGVILVSVENMPVAGHTDLGLPPGNYVAISVRDRGIGIPDEHRERIFEELFTTKSEGSGLGLATCAQIVSEHNGYIDVHSVPNRGSEFSVYLPAVTDSMPTPPTPKVKEPDTAPDNAVSQLKILVVEDQLGVSTIAQMYLEKLGHSVTCVVDGQKGVHAYREAWQSGDAFDLVIMDMTLPGGMNGEDAFRELRRIDPQVVGVATSGSIDRDSLHEYQKKGFATVLPKPFPLTLLAEVVNQAMMFHMV